MKKRVLTRKGRALRWILASVLLAALAWILLPWHLTAEAAHHQAVEEAFIAPTEIAYELESPQGNRRLFSLNEDVLCISVNVPARLGYWRTPWLLECREREPGRPFAVEYAKTTVAEYSPARNVDYYYVFGVVQDEDVTEIVIDFTADVGGHDQTVRLREEDFYSTTSGEQIFLWELEPEVNNLSRSCAVTGYLADGTETETYQLMGMSHWE